MSRADELRRLTEELVECRRCPRLVDWRERVAADKRASFSDESYWGRPVPGFGDPDAELAVIGLAPAAHGANRTGRMFTGDRSGEWLYRAMYRAGFANQPTSTHRDDGLVLRRVWVTAPVRCPPPANKPTAEERERCRSWFDAELAVIDPAVFLALGGFAYQAVWRYLGNRGFRLPRPRPRFNHALEVAVPGGPILIASYHPSQQNTFTGKLTEEMLDAVFARAASFLDAPGRVHLDGERDE